MGVCACAYGWQLFSNVSSDEDSFEVDPEVLDDHPFLDDVGSR